MSVDQAYNFKPVDDRLSTSGVLSAEQLSLLSAEGYGLVINLLPDQSDYAVKGEADIVAGQGIRYEYVPVDFADPKPADYLAFENILAASGDERVLLHCAANYRASAFYAIYAFKNLGLSAAQAREFIHSIWNLDEYPVWRQFVTVMLQ